MVESLSSVFDPDKTFDRRHEGWVTSQDLGYLMSLDIRCLLAVLQASKVKL